MRCFMLELSFPVSGLTPYAVAGCHPLTVFGVLVIFLFDQGFRDSVAPPLPNLLRPLPWAMNSARYARRIYKNFKFKLDHTLDLLYVPGRAYSSICRQTHTNQ